MTINEAQEMLINQFSGIDDWDERYKVIIDSGKELPAFPEEHRIDKFKIEGCQSQVWLYPEFKEGKLLFHADSDAMIVKGLVALIVKVYSGQSPNDILSTPPDFITKIGIDSHLSPTRKNGLNSMLKQIQLYAVAFKAMATR